MVVPELLHAARTLGISRAFALAAAIVIAIGIGASAAIFTVVNAVLLRPLPYRQPDRLVLAGAEMRRRNAGAALFFAIAAAASWLPAWRAAALDPVATLRQQ